MERSGFSVVAGSADALLSMRETTGKTDTPAVVK
jgi:hypothetical protein